MRIFLALFDPSYITRGGAYWSWRSPELNIKLLNKLYYEVANLNRPEDPNQLSNSTILGGFATLGEGFTFAYRFGNGGYDSFGRPGRFVMVVAGLHRDQSGPCDLEVLVSGPVFSKVLADAQQSCPVPAPLELEIDLNLPTSHIDPMLVATVLREKCLSLPGSEGLTGTEVLSRASRVCLSLPPECNWQCKFHIEGGAGIALVEYAEGPSKSPPSNSEWKGEPIRRFGSDALTLRTASTFRVLPSILRNKLLILIILAMLFYCIVKIWLL